MPKIYFKSYTYYLCFGLVKKYSTDSSLRPLCEHVFSLRLWWKSTDILLIREKRLVTRVFEQFEYQRIIIYLFLRISVYYCCFVIFFFFFNYNYSTICNKKKKKSSFTSVFSSLVCLTIPVDTLFYNGINTAWNCEPTINNINNRVLHDVTCMMAKW